MLLRQPRHLSPLKGADDRVGHRHDRIERAAIDQRRQGEQVAGEQEAHDLPAAIVEQHIAHQRALLDHEQFVIP